MATIEKHVVGDQPMGDWALIEISGTRELVAEILEYARHAASADHDGPCRFCGGGPAKKPYACLSCGAGYPAPVGKVRDLCACGGTIEYTSGHQGEQREEL